MFETTKINFINRADFELAVNSILSNFNIRSNSAGSLDVGYADMIFTFSDKNHADRAINKIKELNLKENSDFTIKYE